MQVIKSKDRFTHIKTQFSGLKNGLLQIVT